MGSVRTRLSIMMFLQYFVWGSWGASAGGYMGSALKFSNSEISWIYSTTAIGAMISPLFVGYFADRFFATERILAFLHLVGGGLLIAAGEQTGFTPLMSIMLAYAICFMPTLALTNSISFLNIGDPEKDFPAIRVWGTIGWIAAGLVVGILLGGTEKWFFHMAGGSSILLALYCLTLPHTPPRRGETVSDVFGVEAVGLLREPSFAVFVFCSFLVCIPLAFYYTLANQFLTETDKPVPTALMTIGQVSEIFFMAAMPFFIRRLGVKYMLLIGMLAWVARYLCFSTLEFSWILLGLVLHGVCYDFFFVGSQIYVDQKAPRHLRASAQSFIAFVTLGVGIFVGNYINGKIVDARQYAPLDRQATIQSSGETVRAPLPNWRSQEEYTGFWKYLDLSSTIRAKWFPRAEKSAPPDFAAENDKNHNGKIEADEIPDRWVEQKAAEPKPDEDLVYDGLDIRSAFHVIDDDRDGSISRAEWRAQQAHDWTWIWRWPAWMAAITCLIFLFGFNDRVGAATIEAMAEEAPLGPGEGFEPQVG
ncbi:MAG TPA: MFS transporter [Pirellulales bacterium]|nr:MFS transporter [Pirellulales bacterium]